MLVLSRKEGESIDIGGDIKITVVSINGNAVRLGIEAPRDVPVLREELSSSDGPAVASGKEGGVSTIGAPISGPLSRFVKK